MPFIKPFLLHFRVPINDKNSIRNSSYYYGHFKGYLPIKDEIDKKEKEKSQLMVTGRLGNNISLYISREKELERLGSKETIEQYYVKEKDKNIFNFLINIIYPKYIRKRAEENRETAITNLKKIMNSIPEETSKEVELYKSIEGELSQLLTNVCNVNTKIKGYEHHIKRIKNNITKEEKYESKSKSETDTDTDKEGHNKTYRL